MAQITVKSSETISKNVDQAMNKENPTNGHVEAGISIRHGPVEDMHVDSEPKDVPQINGVNGVTNGKRKARNSIPNGKSYKEDSTSEDDDKPLVSQWL